MEQDNRNEDGSSNQPAASNPGHQTSDAPPSGQPAVPTLESLRSQSYRTHQTWTPKYTRVAKCDFCNERGPGVLMSCAHPRCVKYICETCARSSRWHSDYYHWIDADALDWTVQKAPRRSNPSRGRKRRRSEDRSQQGSPGGPTSERPASTPRRRLGMAPPRVDVDEEADGLPHPIHHAALFPTPSPIAPHNTGHHWAAPAPPAPPAAPPGFYGYHGYNPAAPFFHLPPPPAQSRYPQQGGMQISPPPHHPSPQAFAAPAGHPMAQQAAPYGHYGHYAQQGVMGPAYYPQPNPYAPAFAAPPPRPVAQQDAGVGPFAQQGGMVHDPRPHINPPPRAYLAPSPRPMPQQSVPLNDYAQQSQMEPAQDPQPNPPSSALPAPATRPAVRPRSASGDHPDQGEDHPGPSSPVAPAPTRPAVRQAAARAIAGMTEQARQSDDDGSEYRDDGEDEYDEDDVYNARGSGKKVNKGGRCGNRASRNTGVLTPAQARTVQSGTPSPPEAGPFAPRSSVEHYPRPSVHPVVERAPPATPGPEHDNRDHLVLDIYEFLYQQRPNPDPRRVRSQIPDRSADRESPPQHPSAPAPGSSQQAYESPHGLPTSESPGTTAPPPAAPGPYAPSARTTPAYHPLNDRTPEQVAQYHQDNALQQQMRYAWGAHPILRNLRQDGRRLDAINLLWEVFEVRRARGGVWVPDDSQTVAWFVAERDSQFRMEHMARTLTAPDPHPRPRAHPGPAPLSMPIRGGWSSAAAYSAAAPTPAAGTLGLHRPRLVLGPARRGVDEGEDDDDEEEEEEEE
ncbi:uncharacterized protein B0T15DRAFT_35126 [Chaetomium strumarium]|uniref:Uncharacterized protein n=1 Tax=Chaetomium strumarium TaxID=1170767 RepID=A0AAJ0H1Z1_9PEZI|nr:hypothetical protein B0T15DRAFT_35126 [Chaetomium strumarium]